MNRDGIFRGGLPMRRGAIVTATGIRSNSTLPQYDNMAATRAWVALFGWREHFKSTTTPGPAQLGKMVSFLVVNSGQF
jgi:hypothetical protein